MYYISGSTGFFLSQIKLFFQSAFLQYFKRCDYVSLLLSRKRKSFVVTF